MNTKILLVFVLIATSLSAQEENDDDKKNRTEEDVTLTSSRLYLEAGAVRPIYFGDNFSGKAYEFETGIYIGIAAYISKEWGIRTGYDAARYDNIDEERVGRYRGGLLSHLKFQLFYEYQAKEKLFLRANAGIASVRYRNKALENDQKDKGVAAAFDFTLSYTPFHFLDIYLNTGLYLESLDIKAPPSQKDFFDSAAGFYPALGIRIKT